MKPNTIDTHSHARTRETYGLRNLLPMVLQETIYLFDRFCYQYYNLIACVRHQSYSFLYSVDTVHTHTTINHRYRNTLSIPSLIAFMIENSPPPILLYQPKPISSCLTLLHRTQIASMASDFIICMLMSFE